MTNSHKAGNATLTIFEQQTVAFAMVYINNRALTVFSPLAEELKFSPGKNYLFDLSYLHIMKVNGIQAETFLQGQLTCDVRQVTAQQMQPGASCDLKGRVVTLLDVVNWHGLHLILPADLFKTVQGALAKVALFSKVNLEDAELMHAFGFYHQNPADPIPFNIQLPGEPLHMTQTESYCCYSLGNGLYIFLLNHNEAELISSLFKAQHQWRGSLAWHFLQLQHRQFEIYPESSGLFLPQRLGLQYSGHISFNKGCYKGQEIIARMHYRSKPKHEMKLFQITVDPSLLQSGKKLWTEDGKSEIGEIVDFCPTADGKFLVLGSVVFEHPDMVLLAETQISVRLLPYDET
ncbi:CAF17-like 4Fe-4S cluster assembly/insertion protein YgfZ [Legionella septentrionalis]|uniref:CAF17-like 4Fe-4S cluster assembly/insertion protein YgfZ n=1 Tax=Legionella septentrionalis TaxID=2498109 RepID=UPI000F8F3F24|nr:folate-binding protein YgfZ [Legionella septentrionalis]RUR16097.1 folate-binding protein YgfZ [Legionella septentrionalis]